MEPLPSVADVEAAMARLGDERRTVVLDSGEEHGYLSSGPEDAERTAVFIHGNMSNAYALRPLWEHEQTRAALAGWRVVAPEMRGFGRGSYKSRVTDHAENARDIVALLDRLGVRKAVVLGWSTGGPVALEVAAIIPDRVLGVVMYAAVGVHGYLAARRKGMTRERCDKEIAAGGAGVIASRSVENGLALWRAFVQSERATASPEAEAEALRGMFEQDLRCYSDACWCNLQYDGARAVARLRCPVLVMHGDRDAVIPPASAEKSAASIREAGAAVELAVVAGASHGIFHDREDETARVYSSFVSKL